ncbi:sugar ABC transporter substrate-binding protein [Marinithermofilum abyssi]|uniref:Sugar ABC transporter substrate-binding protein n=1 Tax=Marinithermofilum abyssi TaxID=1571185 RepID=A0A8J2VHE1_9BACL|nr:ABC transporter substrate-binding protein [Marinithermofilum abyssi]GGE15615.1 sugar ABC transporter substrate-binding protein [Marinithermofilum abyssi]
MKRAGLLTLSVAFLFSTLTTGCMAGNESGNKVEIQYWHTQTEEDRVKQIDRLITDFEKKHPHIDVKQVQTPEGDFPAKISASLAANHMPAIIEGSVAQIQQLSNEDVWDTQINKEIIEGIGKNDFYDGALNMVKTPDGKGYYGVPLHGWVQGIWYRKDLFKEKGLQPPTTWENILKAAKAFHNPGKNRYGIVTGTKKDDFTEQTFSQFALSNGAYVFDKKGNVHFNNRRMVEALAYYKKLVRYTPPGSETWRDARDLYLNERTPMMMYSSYIMTDLVNESKNGELAKKTALATPIRHTNKATFGIVTALSVVSIVSDEEKQAAKEFIQYLMKKETNIKYMHMAPGGNNPARKSVAKDPQYLDNQVLRSFGGRASQIAAGMEDLKQFGFRDGKLNPHMGDISAQFIIGEAVSEMIENNWSPEYTAKWAEKEIKKVVESSER